MILLVQPSPFVKNLKAYQLGALPLHVDLPLGGTERPILTHEESIGRYPKINDLDVLIAEKYGVDRSQIILTAGADEALDRLCRAYLAPDREVLVTYPTFEMIAHFATLTGATVKRVHWPKDDYPLAQALEHINEKTSVVFIVSPNNPTGAVVKAETVIQLAQKAPHALIVVDMAYGEYASEDITQAILKYPNIVVVRTFSKALGVPGLRVGYALAHAEVIQWLKTVGSPYSIAHASLIEAKKVWQNNDVENYVKIIQQQRVELCKELENLGANVLPSQANFVLAFFNKASWVKDALLSLGIGSRALTNEPELAQALRITCPGEPQAFMRLKNALRSVVKPQALLFDMDGVLADVAHSYRQAIILTAQTFSVEITAQDITAAKALGNANNDWELTHRLLQQKGVETDLQEVTKRFEDLYQGTETTKGLYQTETLLCLPEILKRLSGKMPLAIVTGRPKKDAERFLKDFGLADYFSAHVCMHDAPLKPKPDPVLLALKKLNVTSAWMLGDTVDDIWAARAAGVVPIGIAPPSENKKEVEATLLQKGAARVLQNIAELEEMLS